MLPYSNNLSHWLSIYRKLFLLTKLVKVCGVRWTYTSNMPIFKFGKTVLKNYKSYCDHSNSILKELFKKLVLNFTLPSERRVGSTSPLNFHHISGSSLRQPCQENLNSLQSQIYFWKTSYFFIICQVFRNHQEENTSHSVPTVTQTNSNLFLLWLFFQFLLPEKFMRNIPHLNILKLHVLL